MGKTLGICVTSEEHLDKIIKLCRAAKRKNVEVNIFFTHTGTRLCKDPRFKELEGLAQTAFCNVSLKSNNIEKPVPGLKEKSYSTQSWQAEMIGECDRYLTF
jgi:hypothetical protein